MASERRDGGQVILLAGILLVLAFILFSTQLALLASLGLQSGRETENALLEDYLLIRRSLHTSLGDELGDGTPPACPDLPDYASRIATHVDLLLAEETLRGYGARFDRLQVDGRVASVVKVNLTVMLDDGTTSIAESLEYRYTCSGAFAYLPPSKQVCLPARDC